MKEDTIYRKVCLSDYQQWLELWAGYNKFYGRYGLITRKINATATSDAKFA